MKRRPGAGAHNPNPQRQQQIAVSLGKPSLRLRMESYYTLIQPDIIADQKRYVKLNKEYKDLKVLVDKREEYIGFTNNITGTSR